MLRGCSDRRSALLRAAIAAAAIVLAACASQTSTFWTRVGQLMPDVTTRDEAIILMGKPTSETAAPGGNVVMRWVDNQPEAAGAKAAQVSVLFDSRGRMVRIAQATRP